MRIDSAAEFTDYWRGVRERTARVIEAHHRGQLYLLLGVHGVRVPQIFGLTEERSRHAVAIEDVNHLAQVAA